MLDSLSWLSSLYGFNESKISSKNKQIEMQKELAFSPQWKFISIIIKIKFLNLCSNSLKLPDTLKKKQLSSACHD